jgi:DNA polymerase III subunit epsilon
MVSNQPTIDKVLPGILKLIGDHVIVGHGVGFDIDILAHAAERHAIPTTIRNNRVLDTHRMARIYGESPINSLEYLCNHFNIPLEESHRAKSDVIVNIELFKHLAKPYRNLEQIFEALSKPITLKTMPFGKFKGRFFNEIPLQELNGLLKWLIQKGFDQDLVHTVRSELKRRKSGNQFYQAANPFLNL